MFAELSKQKIHFSKKGSSKLIICNEMINNNCVEKLLVPFSELKSKLLKFLSYKSEQLVGKYFY